MAFQLLCAATLKSIYVSCATTLPDRGDYESADRQSADRQSADHESADHESADSA